MQDSVMMARMTAPEYRRKVQEEGAILFLPIGATEQHGPHMCMGVDHMLPSDIAALVAERVGGIVAPALNYGYKSQPKSGGGNHFVGTTSLSGATVVALVRDILGEFVRHSARKVVIMNGHYENTMFIVEGVELALLDARRDGVADLRVMRLDYYEFTSPPTIEHVWPDGFPGWALEHAAVFETSLMLHFHPDLVDMSRVANEPPADFPPYDLHPADFSRIPPSGVLSPARGATAEKGRMMADEYAERIAAAVMAEFRSGNAAA